mgnify:FL=1
MQTRGIATKQTQNFALGIATQGLFAYDEQAFLSQFAMTKWCFVFFLIRIFKALRLEI